MLALLPTDSRSAIEPLFRDYPCMPGCIEAALEGRLGQIHVDNPDDPQAGCVQLEFYFLGGDPAAPSAERLVRRFRPGQPAIIAPTPDWVALLRRIWGPALSTYARTSFAPGLWNVRTLKLQAAALHDDVRIVRIQTEEQVQRFSDQIAGSLIHHFGSTSNFLKNGIAFAAEQQSRYIAGIFSFALSRRTFEIEIRTRSHHRRLGLGTALAAHAVLHCIDRGLSPSWDAANPISASLAAKVGFLPRQTYHAYYIPSLPRLA